MNETDAQIKQAQRPKRSSARSGATVAEEAPARTFEAPLTEALDATQSQVANLQHELDRVSLTQALIDTEAATARVIDLTERLVDARRQITELRGELETLRIQHHQIRAEHETMKSSMAFRLATLIWNIRNALRV